MLLAHAVQGSTLTLEWLFVSEGPGPAEAAADRLAECLRGARVDTFGLSDPLRPATLVAVEGAEIIGFATTAPARDAGCSGQGELAALHVDPSAWSRGVGRALIAAARAQLVDREIASALRVHVSADNEITGLALDCDTVEYERNE